MCRCPRLTPPAPPLPSYHYSETANGYGETISRAVKIATGQYLLLLNNDVLFRRGALRALLSTFSTHVKVGAVVPKMIDGADETMILDAGGVIFDDANGWQYVERGRCCCCCCCCCCDC